MHRSVLQTVFAEVGEIVGQEIASHQKTQSKRGMAAAGFAVEGQRHIETI